MDNRRDDLEVHENTLASGGRITLAEIRQPDVHGQKRLDKQLQITCTLAIIF